MLECTTHCGALCPAAFPGGARGQHMFSRPPSLGPWQQVRAVGRQRQESVGHPVWVPAPCFRVPQLCPPTCPRHHLPALTVESRPPSPPARIHCGVPEGAHSSMLVSEA